MATWIEKARSPEYSPAKLSQMLAGLEWNFGDLADSLGGVAFLDKIDKAMLGETVIIGGFLNTELIAAKSLFANHLNIQTLSSLSSDLGFINSGIMDGATVRGVGYNFDSQGFEIKDSNNQVLITPAGILDTNNIARSDNVADGYPLIMRFYIDDQVNTIDKVFLRLTNEKFRAYSTGAASGGGSTSGSSSASTTSDGGSSTPTSGTVDDGFVHGVITSTGPATSGHTHTVWEGQFTHTHKVTIGSHTHGMSHTHSTPDHTHGQVYGIYEDAVPNNVVTVWVDGVQRASLSTQDASANLSTWLTTKGWHTVEIRSAVRKRISAGLFIKSYIQR